MQPNFEYELQEEIEFLYQELAFLQESIETSRTEGNTEEYTRLMRIFLPVQKQYLKLCAEQEKRLQAETDELAAFNGAMP